MTVARKDSLKIAAFLFAALALIALINSWWAPARWSYWATIALLFGLVAALDRFVYLLRDAKKDVPPSETSYSLGRAQMAFWTVLVLATIIHIVAVKIWACVPGAEQCIVFDPLKLNTSILILLGISGATGITSMAVDIDKDKAAATAEEEQRTTEAVIESATLAVQRTDDGAETLRATQQLQSATLQHAQATVTRSRAQRDTSTHGFFRDLLQDSNGNSLHRLQMILFTLTAGIIFVAQVLTSKDGTLPTIPDEVLSLLGISNGLYVGFKVPGK